MNSYDGQLQAVAPTVSTPNPDGQQTTKRMTVLEALAEETTAISPNRSNRSTKLKPQNDPDPDDQ